MESDKPAREPHPHQASVVSDGRRWFALDGLETA
jgi:hypothetical protein